MISRSSPESLKRRSQRAAIASLVGFVIVLLTLFYSSSQVYVAQKKLSSLSKDLDDTTKRLEEANKQLGEANKQIAEAAGTLEISSEEVSFLKNYNFLQSNPDLGIPDLQSLLKEKHDVEKEIGAYKPLPSDRSRRSGITIKYYFRAVDRNRVNDAMTRLRSDHGFRLLESPGRETVCHTNAIWVNRASAKQEDVKLVAYYLILYGFQIKYIGPPSSTPERAGKVNAAIMVVAEPTVDDDPPLTIKSIRELSPESIKKGTKIK